MVGAKPVFDPSMRTTGLGIDPITGSVPFGIYQTKMKPAFRELTGWAFRGDDLSQKDLRNFQSLIWAPKIPGLDQLINKSFINRFPEQD